MKTFQTRKYFGTEAVQCGGAVHGEILREKLKLLKLIKSTFEISCQHRDDVRARRKEFHGADEEPGERGKSMHVNNAEVKKRSGAHIDTSMQCSRNVDMASTPGLKVIGRS